MIEEMTPLIEHIYSNKDWKKLYNRSKNRETGNVLLDATTLVYSNELLNNKELSLNGVYDLGVLIDSIILNEKIVTVRPDGNWAPVSRYDDAIENFKQLDIKIYRIDNEERDNPLFNSFDLWCKPIKPDDRMNIWKFNLIQMDERTNPYIDKEIDDKKIMDLYNTINNTLSIPDTNNLNYLFKIKRQIKGSNKKSIKKEIINILKMNDIILPENTIVSKINFDTWNIINDNTEYIIKTFPFETKVYSRTFKHNSYIRINDSENYCFDYECLAYLGSLYGQLQYGDTIVENLYDDENYMYEIELNEKVKNPYQIILWRTQLYYQLMTILDTPYRPDSFRVNFYVKELERINKEIKDYIFNVIKTIELNEEEYVQCFNKLPSGSLLESRTPLFLTYILNQSNSPSDIIEEAIKIRNQHSTLRFRKYLKKIEDLLKNDPLNINDIYKYQKQILDALTIINKDYGESYTANNITTSFKIGSELVLTSKGTPSLINILSNMTEKPSTLKKFILRLNMSFIHKIVNRSREIIGLNSELKRVFNKSLSKNDIDLIKKLR